MNIENPWEKEQDKKWEVDNSIKRDSIEKDDWEPKEEWKVDNAVKASDINDPWENKEKKSEPLVLNEKWNVNIPIKEITTAETKEIDPWKNENNGKEDRTV